MKVLRLLLCLLSLPLWAQENLRLEIPLAARNTEVFAIPLGKQGVAVLQQLGKQEFSLQKYNAQLQQDWASNGRVENNMDYVNHSFDGKYLHLLFSRYKSNAYLIFRVDISQGQLEKYQIYSVERMEISNFVASHQSLFIGGIVNNQPLILFTDLGQKKTRILPSVVKGSSEIQSMDLDTTQGLIHVTYSVGNKAKNYQLLVRSFDEEGNQINQVVMNPTEEFAMMNAKSNQLNDSLQIIVGTYGHRGSIGSTRGPTSQGMYFSTYMDGELLNQKFHSFTKFDNFFNFLSDKQKERQEKRIRDKEGKGEDLRLDYRLLVHEIIKKGDHYLVVAEAFYPDYRYQNAMMSPLGANMFFPPFSGPFFSPWTMMYNPFRWGYGYYGLYSPFSSYYSPWGYRGLGYYGNSQQFDGWVYTHAVVAEFDQEGNKIWDHCIDLNDIKEEKLIQKIKASVQGDKVVLSYVNKNDLISKVISENGRNESEEVKPLYQEHNGEELKRVAKTDLNYWYDQYFLADGIQTLASDEEGRRTVFYLSKIKF